jgi:predicted HAD superfamily Cof-like phosphohydrolase
MAMEEQEETTVSRQRTKRGHVKNSLLVREMMQLYGQDTPKRPGWPARRVIWMRVRLIWEEFRELLWAVWKRDMVKTADAITDLLVVVYGMALALGIPIDECFREVHRSNMSKMGEDGKPIYRGDGKVVKGPNYREPDLRMVINA